MVTEVKWTESWSSAKGQIVALQMRTCKFDCESMDAGWTPLSVKWVYATPSWPGM